MKLNWHLSEINKFRAMDTTGFLSFFPLFPFCLFVCLFVVVVVVVVVSFFLGGGGRESSKNFNNYN